MYGYHHNEFTRLYDYRLVQIKWCGDVPYKNNFKCFKGVWNCKLHQQICIYETISWYSLSSNIVNVGCDKRARLIQFHCVFIIIYRDNNSSESILTIRGISKTENTKLQNNTYSTHSNIYRGRWHRRSGEVHRILLQMPSSIVESENLKLPKKEQSSTKPTTIFSVI